MPTDSTLICRTVEFDMGHRVTNHDGKCKSPHGHRYKVEIYFRGPLQNSGSSEGMVVDFGFVKSLADEILIAVFDHGFCIWKEDDLRTAFGAKKVSYVLEGALLHDGTRMLYGYVSHTLYGKVIVIDRVPTAENLAHLWGLMLMGQSWPEGCVLAKVRVWETPNCFAEVDFAS